MSITIKVYKNNLRNDRFRLDNDRCDGARSEKNQEVSIMMNPIAVSEYGKVRQLELETEIEQDRLARILRNNKQFLPTKRRPIVALGSFMLGVLIMTQAFVG